MKVTFTRRTWPRVPPRKPAVVHRPNGKRRACRDSISPYRARKNSRVSCQQSHSPGIRSKIVPGKEKLHKHQAFAASPHPDIYRDETSPAGSRGSVAAAGQGLHVCGTKHNTLASISLTQSYKSNVMHKLSDNI